MKRPSRPLSELFILLKNEIRLLTTGLCALVTLLYNKDLIDEYEKFLLKTYIQTHKPRRNSKHYNDYSEVFLWYWFRGEKEPRLAWIEDQIKKLQKDEKKKAKNSTGSGKKECSV